MKWAIKEIDRRFDIFKETNCKDISQYKGSETMPHILIVIDEFSDIIQTYPEIFSLTTLNEVKITYKYNNFLIDLSEKINKELEQYDKSPW